MVYRATSRHTSLKKGRSLFVVFLSIFAITIGAIVGVSIKSSQKSKETADTNLPKVPQIVEPDTPPSPTIDFQTLIDQWVAEQSGETSVIIYDLNQNQILGERNPDEIYDTASLYKLFVVYEGYRRLERGELLPDSPAGSTGNTILECLDLAIRESSSECAETILREIGIENLNQIIATDFGISSTDLSSYISTPRDILKIMQIYYTHSDITNQDYINQIKDSFLNQPATIYNWRQGLPSGFSVADVYDKVGWDYNPAGYWNIYHDAAIVDFKSQNQQYIIIVMTAGVPFQNIRNFGTIIENIVINKY